MNFSAVILAGGQSKRMNGRDKAMLLIEGKPIIERTIGVLRLIFKDIVIVTNEARDYSYEGVKVTKDKIIKVGPLGGIYTGLCAVKNEAAFFVACDMPFLHRDVILNVIDTFKASDFDALLPRVGNKTEPLCAVYKSSLKDKIYEYVIGNHDLAVREFLKKIKVGYLEFEDDDSHRQVFKNMNTPQDLQ